MTRDLSPTRDLASRLAHESLKTLAVHGCEIAVPDAINAVGERVDLGECARASTLSSTARRSRGVTSRAA